MEIKVKKKKFGRIARFETTGKIKEFIFKEDVLKSKESSLLLCFRGKDSSGIIELSPGDIEKVYEEISYRKKLLSGAKVMKFEK